MSVNWIEDKDALFCSCCGALFTFTLRRHHCRHCGNIFCHDCSIKTIVLPEKFNCGSSPQRVCETCFMIVGSGWDQLSDEVLNAKYYLRELEGGCKFSRVVDIGTRGIPEKVFFVIKDSKTNADLILNTIRINKNYSAPHANEKERNGLVSLLKALRHPFLLPCLHVIYNKDKDQFAIIRPFCSKGSVKDILYGKSPLHAANLKYSSSSSSSSVVPFRDENIALIGRQVLEALLFLRSKDFPSSHLHSGNVMQIANGHYCLAEVDNNLSGLTPKQSTLLVNILKTVPKATVESIQFGMLIFELATGLVLTNLDEIKRCPSSKVLEVLTFIFLQNANTDAASMPEVTEISSLPFFKNIKLKVDAEFLYQPTFDGKLPSICRAAKKQAEQYFADQMALIISNNNNNNNNNNSNSNNNHVGNSSNNNNNNSTGSASSTSTSQKTKKSSSSSKGSTKKSIGVPHATTVTVTLTTTTPNTTATTAARSQSTTVTAPPPPPPASSSSSTTTKNSSSSSSAPPPPPPPSKGAPPPPPPPASVDIPAPSAERSSLLASIQKGTKLKKAVTVDKSKPKI